MSGHDAAIAILKNAALTTRLQFGAAGSVADPLDAIGSSPREICSGLVTIAKRQTGSTKLATLRRLEAYATRHSLTDVAAKTATLVRAVEDELVQKVMMSVDQKIMTKER
jgi:hypothetical protein